MIGTVTGVDEVGLHRESSGFFYWRDTHTTGVADGQIFHGDPGDRFVAGDWGIVDGTDTPAIFRPSDLTFYFRRHPDSGCRRLPVHLDRSRVSLVAEAGQFGLD